MYSHFHTVGHSLIEKDVNTKFYMRHNFSKTFIKCDKVSNFFISWMYHYFTKVYQTISKQTSDGGLFHFI